MLLFARVISKQSQPKLGETTTMAKLKSSANGINEMQESEREIEMESGRWRDFLFILVLFDVVFSPNEI